MTKVTVSSWVKVKDGPNLATSVELDPEAVTQATVVLDAATGAEPEKTVELLAAAGDVALLALSVVASGEPTASITVTPRNGTDTGTALEVTDALVVANSAVLGGLVTGGPRALTLTNAGSSAVTVDLIAARSD